MLAAPAVGREPDRAPRARRDLEKSRELLEPQAVDIALEVDHRLQRNPVVVPAPRVELGMAARAQADVAVAAAKPQQEPDLLLSLVGAAPLALHPMGGHVVVQPVARAPE